MNKETLTEHVRAHFNIKTPLHNCQSFCCSMIRVFPLCSSSSGQQQVVFARDTQSCQALIRAAAAADPPASSLYILAPDMELYACRHTGSIHLCGNEGVCDFYVLTDSGEWVCRYTGLILGRERRMDGYTEACFRYADFNGENKRRAHLQESIEKLLDFETAPQRIVSAPKRGILGGGGGGKASSQQQERRIIVSSSAVVSLEEKGQRDARVESWVQIKRRRCLSHKYFTGRSLALALQELTFALCLRFFSNENRALCEQHYAQNTQALRSSLVRQYLLGGGGGSSTDSTTTSLTDLVTQVQSSVAEQAPPPLKIQFTNREYQRLVVIGYALKILALFHACVSTDPHLRDLFFEEKTRNCRCDRYQLFVVLCLLEWLPNGITITPPGVCLLKTHSLLRAFAQNPYLVIDNLLCKHQQQKTTTKKKKKDPTEYYEKIGTLNKELYACFFRTVSQNRHNSRETLLNAFSHAVMVTSTDQLDFSPETLWQ